MMHLTKQNSIAELSKSLRGTSYSSSNTCMYICMHMHICVCVYVCMYMRVCQLAIDSFYACMYACMHVCMY
jgi:hypothetical protein